MADRETTFRLKFENEDMTKVFDQLIDRVEELNKEFDDLQKSQRETFDSTAKNAQKANEQLKQQTATLDANKVKFKEIQTSAGDAFENIANKGGEASGALARLGRTAGPVGAAITGIGLAIVAAFLDVEKNAKAAQVRLAGLKAVGEELKTRVFAGIRSIVKLWAKDLAAASLELAEFLGIGRKSLDEIDKLGQELEKQRIAFAKVNQALIRQDAQRAVQLQKINALRADENLTTEQQIKLIRSAAQLEVELNRSREEQLSKRLQILFQESELFGESSERLEEIASIEAEIIELRGVNQVIAIQNQQEINSLLKEEAETRERIIESIKDANALIEGQTVERALEKQIQSFQDLRDSIVASGLADEYAEELANLDRVIDGLGQRLEAGLVKPLSELPEQINDILQVESISADPLSEQLAEAGIEAAERLAKSFKERYEELTKDQKRFLEEQLSSVFNSISDIVVQSTLTQITQQDQIIDAREDSISALEQQLEKQDQLESDGIANQSSRLRQSLQQEREILKREQNRRLELEKRAARQRLVANSLQQGSEITLATAKLLNQGASGFIPGLIAAAGGIALLFRIISQAKANAAAFSAPPQFREGTPYLVGPSHEGGGVLIEAEGGERILSRALNETLGGRQMSNDELVDFALKGMNAEQAIAPMAAAIASGSESRHKLAEVEAWERNESMTGVFQAEIRSLKETVERLMKERPTYHPTDQHGRREYYQGNTKIVEVIKPINQ